MKIDHAEFNKIKILDYRAKFISWTNYGFGGNFETFKTLEEARKNTSNGEIYIAFKIENK